ncbi:MAG: aminopeptidase N [Paracoccaceae bacterium]
MKNQIVRLKDYQPVPFDIKDVYLKFKLDPKKTIVSSKMNILPTGNSDLFLNGSQLKLKSIKINGADATSLVTHNDKGINFSKTNLPKKQFILEIINEIDPDANTALEGLFMSNGIYCTQCEAEGFRKITYFLDRPDILTKYKVRIESKLPVLLSNGEITRRGKNWVEWTDPWPKPSYLFAIVAGNLESYDDVFITRSKKKVVLKIWVRKEDIKKCEFAMDALKRSMAWDEINYEREYDLNIFQIVAVDDFTAGAMENKGLNIFNSKYILASPETATDDDYKYIEGIIAHEYFHNWTGNRITCRDWFQLSLKEGLTVFRDQQFSSDQRGYSLKRISDVIDLRNRQFKEDNGPLSHPVQPKEYKEINNFYTSTIYEKGAELINMLHRLVGSYAYKETLNLYFERHDGDACTIEDWLNVFQDYNKINLDQFKLWYEQNGTPVITVEEHFENTTYKLKLIQETDKKHPSKKPMVIPILIGLIDIEGKEILKDHLLNLTKNEQEFTFNNIQTKPTLSILRDFSAPVIINKKTTNEENAFLLQNDTNDFTRWESGQKLALNSIINTILNHEPINECYAESIRSVANNNNLMPGFRALLLKLPTHESITDQLKKLNQHVDPNQIYKALTVTQSSQASILKEDLPNILDKLSNKVNKNNNLEASGWRDLQSILLKLNTFNDGGELAFQKYFDADNMTNLQGALIALMTTKYREEIINNFYQNWKDDKLVIDKWFAIQAIHTGPETALRNVVNLSKHVDFDYKNPNRFRALIGSFCISNHPGFHDISGKGYGFAADWIIAQDKINPQVAARLSTVFQACSKYNIQRQRLMKQEIMRISLTKDLSIDTKEIIDKIIA